MAKASLRQQSDSATRAVLEKRRSERAPLVVRVDYTTVDAFFSEFTSNVNEGGVFVETESPPPLGTHVVLKFKLPGSEEPLKVRGRVVWTHHERSADTPGMGIEFESLDDDARARIDRLVRELRASAPPRASDADGLRKRS